MLNAMSCAIEKTLPVAITTIIRASGLFTTCNKPNIVPTETAAQTMVTKEFILTLFAEENMWLSGCRDRENGAGINHITERIHNSRASNEGTQSR